MNIPARPSAFLLALAACALVMSARASEEDAARHRIGVPKLQGRADIRTEEVESPTLSRVEKSLKETQALIIKIRETGDPAERRTLMDQHLRLLNDNLAQLRTLMNDDLSKPHLSKSLNLAQAVLDQMSERQKIEPADTK